MFRALLIAITIIAAAPAWAASPEQLTAIDADAMSGDPERIHKSISAYETLGAKDPDVQWRLVRAYFNYYDELTDRDRRKEQAWAADRGYAIALSAYTAHPAYPEIVYYYATIGLCYLDFHRMKALFIVNDLLDAFEKSRKMIPAIDDGGPDRSLGILYHELPGWPLGRGDKRKALDHLQAALKFSPTRAANRITLAKVLAEQKRYAEGWTHIEFVRAGQFKVSSPHWHAIYLKRVEEVAQDFPQNQAKN